LTNSPLFIEYFRDSEGGRLNLQPVDFTTLSAICQDLMRSALPARLEQVHQRDRTTLCLALRTLTGRDWLTLSWHPQGARLHLDDAPPREPDTFTFSQQLIHQIGGLALCEIVIASPWERVVDLRFAQRPGDPILWHLYLEVMGQYSNAILVNEDGEIVTAAHQVSAKQSSLRPIQTGDRYELPPRSLLPSPSLTEPFDLWQERLALVPMSLKKLFIRNYRGVSSALTLELLASAGLDPQGQNTDLAPNEWQQLFTRWQTWLHCLDTHEFSPQYTDRGYTVLGNFSGQTESAPIQLSIQLPIQLQSLLQGYYGGNLTQQAFQQLHHQLEQRLKGLLEKLYVKRDGFRSRLDESDRADEIRAQADLMMANLQVWQPGMTEMILTEFETGDQVCIQLSPDRNAIQNAQAFYKQHQKFKRSRDAVTPLLTEVELEIAYLQQVETALKQTEIVDLAAIEDIRDELIQQGYLAPPAYRSDRPKVISHGNRKDKPIAHQRSTKSTTKGSNAKGSSKGSSKGKPSKDQPESTSQPRRYQTPNGYELLIGRNNRQNDILTFRTAGDYDLWFHTQEIPGSHVLLRLPAGIVPDDTDLQGVADLAAYYSQARLSDRVPVVYTAPKHVYKPKGAKPGMAIYKQETVIWGNPRSAFVLSTTTR
jgi:predicted ribosome quality control (RQC) complex YloA/Tae2 family protein